MSGVYNFVMTTSIAVLMAGLKLKKKEEAEAKEAPEPLVIVDADPESEPPEPVVIIDNDPEPVDEEKTEEPNPEA